MPLNRSLTCAALMRAAICCLAPRKGDLMHRSSNFRVCVAVAWLTVCLPEARGGVIVLGDIYTSDSSSLSIKHYTSAGAYVESITLPSSFGTSVRGPAFGPDGLLYATISNGVSGFNVVSLNSVGAIQQVYSGPEYLGGDAT